MTSEEIRQKFLNFFQEKGHIIVSSSSLLPTDPSVLLTTAGVQQFKPYYTSQLDPEKDFGARRVASAQKCFRATDIEDVGDKTHLTFFEMLGNFCFNDYWKKEAIIWGYEFITKELKVSPERIQVSIFSGNDQIPKDEESYSIWHKEIGLSKDKIQLAGIEDNFWGPTGNGGPCGPTTEIYIDGIEVWNIVFNEYYCHGTREQLLKGEVKLEKLKANGIDTGMGLERLVAVLNGASDVFEIDLFHPLLEIIREVAPSLEEKKKRIITDHIRASIFLIIDGIRPLNKEAGYILRRLLRRIMTYEIDFPMLVEKSVSWVSEKYSSYYPEVKETGKISEVLLAEYEKFGKTLAVGIKELDKIDKLTGEGAFNLYQSFGLPPEVIMEHRSFSMEEFNQAKTKHHDISSAGMEKKFGGHGLILDTGELKAGNQEELEKVLRLHTATHLLQQALRDVLGNEVKQAGSDITAERTRFDFSFSRKMTSEEIKKIENKVNEIIEKDLPVAFEQLPKDEAMKTGALFFFKEKYPEKVKVYYIGHRMSDAFSKEFCGGPHVDHTLQIGKFKILKEESVGAGLRRIRATVLD
ncbi:MAG: alanine--tRNA ligase-related protein [Patescibacteria group bacterium]